MVVGEFTFHGVGQGLFYSARIYHGNDNSVFNFIYDCGTLRKKDKNRLETAIDVCYAHERDEKIIHALFISHFHADHISGIPKLLREYKVRNIFIPCFSPEELLLLCIENEIDENSDLFLLYSDPIAYFSGMSNANIFVIGSQPDDKDRFDNTQELNNETRDFVFYGDFSLDLNDEKGNIVYRCNSLFLKAYRYDWVFQIYQDQDKYHQEDIRNQIQMLYTKRYGGESKLDLAKVLQDKSFVQSAKRLYDKVQGKINQSSLVLYHAPTKSYMSNAYFNCCNCCWHLRYNNAWAIATLLTGDINLKNLRRNGDDLKTFIDHAPMQVGFFQIPHHGSKYNTSINLIQKIFPHYMEMVCCYGRQNRFHHPDAYMLDQLMHSNCNRVHHVVEGNDFTYRIKLEEY